MPKFTCKVCGVQHNAAQNPPARCLICEDDRQYVREEGQQWVELEKHKNQHDTIWRKVEDNVYRLSITPHLVGIGQNAHFIQTQNGNYLWDCMPLVSDQLIEDIKARGGLKAIAISHPHFYSNVADWSAAFGNIPIYIHINDRPWVQEASDNILFWEGDELRLENDLTLVKCGGHFNGSSVMHWSGTADGKGALFASDTISPQKRINSISFMYSFPNVIPLPARKVAHIGKIIAPYKFDRLYGAFGQNVMPNADQLVQQSVKRYIKALE